MLTIEAEIRRTNKNVLTKGSKHPINMQMGYQRQYLKLTSKQIVIFYVFIPMKGKVNKPKSKRKTGASLKSSNIKVLRVRIPKVVFNYYEYVKKE